MYLPQIGCYLLLAWLVAELSIKLRYRLWILGSLSAVIIAALMFCARAQTACWAGSEALWTHTLACTSGNDVACNNLGILLYQQGRVDDAIDDFRQAVKFAPGNAAYHGNLANALLRVRHVDEAISEYREAIKILPGDAGFHNDLGDALYDNGQMDDAIAEYKEALRIDPGNKAIENQMIRIMLRKALSRHASNPPTTNTPAR
jgi:tetratricopeptide (TPR) repeat protein